MKAKKRTLESSGENGLERKLDSITRKVVAVKKNQYYYLAIGLKRSTRVCQALSLRPIKKGKGCGYTRLV